MYKKVLLLVFVNMLFVFGSSVTVEGQTGNIYNIKLLSDNMVDWTDLDSFVHDATDNWQTNDEKFEAIAYWISKCGQQQTVPREHDDPVTDPSMFFNSYGGTNCGIWTALLCSIADNGMHKIDPEWRGIYREYPSHTIGSIWYDGQEHLYDGTYKLYTYEPDGKTISDTWGYNIAHDSGQGNSDAGHNIYFYCPFATGNDYDGNGPNNNYFVGAYSPYSSLNGRRYYGYSIPISDEGKGEIRHWAEQGFEYTLGLRMNESYTRFSEPLGFTEEYYRPAGRYEPGTDPDEDYERYNIRGNGEWIYEPDFGTDDFLKGIYSIEGIIRDLIPKIHPISIGTETSIVFKVQAANVVTGASLEADVIRGSDDSLIIEYSTDLGHSWVTIVDNPETGSMNIAFNSIAGSFTGKGGIYNHLLRVRMNATGSTIDVGLDSLKIKTLTMINRKAFPSLQVGRNYITLNLGEQLETNTLWPAISSFDGSQPFYEDYAIDFSSNLVWRGSGGDKDWFRALTLDSIGDGWLTFQIDAPNDIKKIRMGGRLRTLYPEDYIQFQYKLGASGDWITIDTLDHDDVIDPYLWEQTPFYEVNISDAGVRSVQFRYLIHVGTDGDTYIATAGLISAIMEADYLPYDVNHLPLEVTYNWTEHWGNDSSIDSVNRQHTELVTSFPHSYYINVGGNYDPWTNWVSVNLQGSSPNPVSNGYSDGTDYGDTYDVPRYKYFYGELISRGYSYTSSQPTDTSGGYNNLVDETGISLTDGYSLGPSVGDSGVGYYELAGYSDNPEFVIDLGMEQSVGGFRVDNYRNEDTNCYSPEKFDVYVSVDDLNFEHVGSVYTNNYAINWPGFWPLWKSWDAVRYDPNDEASPPDPRAYGLWTMYWHLMPDNPLNARYVKFSFNNPSGKRICLADLRVYNVLQRIPWYPKHTHSDPLDNIDPVDTNEPFVSTRTPRAGETVSADSTVWAHIYDYQSGVDESSVVMKVNGQIVNPIITGSERNTIIRYDNTDGFTPGESVTVTLDAKDLAGNVMPQETYSLFVEGSSCIPGLVAYYSFDTDSGSTVIDYSGNGNDGTVTGAVHNSSGGVFNGAYEFDGNDDYILINDDPTLDVTDELTLTAWVYPTSITDYDYIISKASDTWAPPYIYYALGFNSNTERLRFRIFTDSAYQAVSHVITPGQWYHVAGTYSASQNNLSIYINGVLADSIYASGPISVNDKDVLIGGYEYGPAESWNGYLDEVAVWNRTLSAQEVQELYNSGMPLTCFHRADSDEDGCITMNELTAFIDSWKYDSTAYPMWEMMRAVGLWKSGEGC